MVVLEKQTLKENQKKYQNTVSKLRKEIALTVPIDHVGSTAIPNMCGKNIIDILIGAKNEVELNELSTKIIDMGYYCGRNNTNPIYRFFANTPEETKSGDIHIHLAIIDSIRYQEFLILKNYLINNKEETKNYSNFKKDILKQGYIDRETYKEIKSKYVHLLLERAKKSITTK